MLCDSRYAEDDDDVVPSTPSRDPTSILRDIASPRTTARRKVHFQTLEDTCEAMPSDWLVVQEMFAGKPRKLPRRTPKKRPSKRRFSLPSHVRSPVVTGRRGTYSQRNSPVLMTPPAVRTQKCSARAMLMANAAKKMIQDEGTIASPMRSPASRSVEGESGAYAALLNDLQTVVLTPPSEGSASRKDYLVDTNSFQISSVEEYCEGLTIYGGEWAEDDMLEEEPNVPDSPIEASNPDNVIIDDSVDENEAPASDVTINTCTSEVPTDIQSDDSSHSASESKPDEVNMDGESQPIEGSVTESSDGQTANGVTPVAIELYVDDDRTSSEVLICSKPTPSPDSVHDVTKIVHHEPASDISVLEGDGDECAKGIVADPETDIAELTSLPTDVVEAMYSSSEDVSDPPSEDEFQLDSEPYEPLKLDIQVEHDENSTADIVKESCDPLNEFPTDDPGQNPSLELEVEPAQWLSPKAPESLKVENEFSIVTPTPHSGPDSIHVSPADTPQELASPQTQMDVDWSPEASTATLRTEPTSEPEDEEDALDSSEEHTLDSASQVSTSAGLASTRCTSETPIAALPQQLFQDVNDPSSILQASKTSLLCPDVVNVSTSFSIEQDENTPITPGKPQLVPEVPASNNPFEKSFRTMLCSTPGGSVGEKLPEFNSRDTSRTVSLSPRKRRLSSFQEPNRSKLRSRGTTPYQLPRATPKSVVSTPKDVPEIKEKDRSSRSRSSSKSKDKEKKRKSSSRSKSKSDRKKRRRRSSSRMGRSVALDAGDIVCVLGDGSTVDKFWLFELTTSSRVELAGASTTLQGFYLNQIGQTGVYLRDPRISKDTIQTENILRSGVELVVIELQPTALPKKFSILPELTKGLNALVKKLLRNS